jgi:cytochrome c oxidase cbb3-type subunit 3
MTRINSNAIRLGLAVAVLCIAAAAGPVAAFGVGGAGEGAADAGRPQAGGPEAAKEGEALFGRICQQCHNTRGHGGKCPQLVRGAWAPGGANSDQLMFDTIAHGRPNTQMGAFAGMLSDAQIWQIVTFLREESVRVQAADAKAPKDEEADLWY